MNKKDLATKRNDTQRLYHVPGMANITNRKRNAVFISPSNSLEHEIGKMKVCYELRKEKMQFITEAVCNKTQKRRDVVCLDDGMIFEIETDKKRAERFKDQKGVVVIKLWKEVS